MQLLTEEEQKLHRNEVNPDPINVCYIKELKYAALSAPGRMEEVPVMFNVVICNLKCYQSTTKMQCSL